MIRAIRPNAMAQDDASLVSGWNISPNVAYVVQLNPGSSACGVLVYSEDQTAIIASGAGLVGTDQPVILHPYFGQTIGMVDTDLGWHLLLATEGTEYPRTIRIGPAVDLPDEIHPIYADDDLSVVRATAGVDDHAHYIDDISVTCPLGFGAWIGDIARTPVDGTPVDGQTESITWIGTPNGTSDAAVIRRHVAIAPEPWADPPAPPIVVDDTGTTASTATTAGNVLANDNTGLQVVAVNGLSASVGVAVDGDNGGTFVIAADGSWTFDPTGDFALLVGDETAETSVSYHASDGMSEAAATLNVTVFVGNTAPVAVDDVGTTNAVSIATGNVLTNDTDVDPDTLTVSRVNGSSGSVGVPVGGTNGGLFTIMANGAWSFNPNGNFSSLSGNNTATTSVAYRVSDGEAEDEGTLTVTVSAPPPSIAFVGKSSVAVRDTNATVSLNLPAGILPGDMVIVALMIGARTDVAMSMNTAGYTKVTELYANDTEDTNLAVFWKIMGQTPDTVAVANKVASTSGYSTVVSAHVWRGAASIGAYAQASGIDTNLGTYPSITPGADGIVVAIGGAVGGTIYESNVSGFALPAGSGLENHEYKYHLGSNYNSAVLSVASRQGLTGPVSLGTWTGLANAATYSWASVVLSLSTS